MPEAHDKNTKRGRCVYCGETRILTADHVPPKGWFPRPLPPNLVTVPSCAKCNASHSKDDEYVRLVLILDEKSKKSKDRASVFQTVKRSLERNEAAGLRRSLINSSRVVERFSRSGLFIGFQREFRMSGKRLNRAAERLTKAFFFREMGYILPHDHKITTISWRLMPRLCEINMEVAMATMEIFAELIQQKKTSFADTFAYYWLRFPGENSTTAWLFSIYGFPEYVCTTLRKNDPAKS